jgi:hypothetical protein
MLWGIYIPKSLRVDVMESLTPEQYRRMVKKIIEFKELNGKLPEYTTVEGCRIEKKAFINMIERVNKFFLEMGRNPEMIQIIIDEEPCLPPEHLSI